MGVKGGTTSNSGLQQTWGNTASNMTGDKTTNTAENTQQAINTANTGYTNQNTASQQQGTTNDVRTTAGTAPSQTQAWQVIDAQNRLFGREAPGLTAFDPTHYLNPFASYALAGLNQQLGVGDKRLRSSNISQMGGVGGDRGAVSEALNFNQDQLARGQLMEGFYDRAAALAQQQQQAQYNAAIYGYQAPWTQTGQMAANLAQLQPTLGQIQTGTGQTYNTGNVGVTGTNQQYGTQTADTTKNLTSNVGTNVNTTGSNLGLQFGNNDQSNTMSPFQVGAGLLTSALAFMPAASGGRIPHKAGGGGMDDDIPMPPPPPQIHFADLFKGLPTNREGQKVPDLSGIASKAKSNESYGGGSPFSALFGQSAYGGSSEKPLPGLVGGTGPDSDYGPGYARGGSPYAFRGYDDGGTVYDDSDAVNAGDPIRVDPEAYERWRQGEDQAKAAGLTRQPAPLPPQITGQPDAAPMSFAASGPYSRGAPPPESYSEWRRRQDFSNSDDERQKLPFGLSANKFLLRAGLGILGAGSGATSNPVTAIGKGFTGALDAQQKEEDNRRELYNTYLSQEQKERFHKDTTDLQREALDKKDVLTPYQQKTLDIHERQLKEAERRNDFLQAARVNRAKANAEWKAQDAYNKALNGPELLGATEQQKAEYLNRMRVRFRLEEEDLNPGGVPQAVPQTATPQSAAPQRPSSVPAGSAWSPSKKMWRDPSGKLYDEQGNTLAAQ